MTKSNIIGFAVVGVLAAAIVVMIVMAGRKQYAPPPYGQLPNVVLHVPGPCLAAALRVVAGGPTKELDMYQALKLENMVQDCGGTVEHVTNLPPHTIERANSPSGEAANP